MRFLVLSSYYRLFLSIFPCLCSSLNKLTITTNYLIKLFIKLTEDCYKIYCIIYYQMFFCKRRFEGDILLHKNKSLKCYQLIALQTVCLIFLPLTSFSDRIKIGTSCHIKGPNARACTLHGTVFYRYLIY